jgi:hypothetical protein
MPATVDDFIKNFSGPGTMDDKQATQYYDRFASTRPEDSQFDNQALHSGAAEYLGQVPEDQFHQAAQNAFTQAAPAQRQGLLSSLIGSLTGRGVDMSSLGSQLGLQSTNPATMAPTDYSRLANYARLNHPDVMQDHVQSQPWLLKAMGNPFVIGALGMVASKMLHRQAA